MLTSEQCTSSNRMLNNIILKESERKERETKMVAERAVFAICELSSILDLYPPS